MTREEAINTLKENCCSMCPYGSVYMDFCDIHSCYNRDAIKALEQESKWIPVSERLPEKDAWVLVTVEQSGKYYQEIMRRYKFQNLYTDIRPNEIIAWKPLHKPEQISKYYQEMRKNEHIEIWGDITDIYTDEIIAWMPLPEPYKAESEDN